MKKANSLILSEQAWPQSGVLLSGFLCMSAVDFGTLSSRPGINTKIRAQNIEIFTFSLTVIGNKATQQH